MQHKWLWFFIVWGISGFCQTAFSEVIVITNPQVKLDSISKKQLKKLWLGNKHRRVNGIKLSPVDHDDDTPIRLSFYAKIVKKSARQMKAYWTKAIYHGNKFPPKKVNNSTAVKQWILSHENGIGYIDAADLTDNENASFKILLRIK